MLIAFALLGLTIITFETMFTSLEQNLTNITQSVVKQDNRINKLNGRVIELAEQKKKILEKNDNQISDEIKSQVKALQLERNSKVLEIFLSISFHCILEWPNHRNHNN